jgi:hypothetical protein
LFRKRRFIFFQTHSPSVSPTSRYAWLLFSDNSVLNLSENVLSTEAHPLPLLQKRINCANVHDDEAAAEVRGAGDGDTSGSSEDAAADSASRAAAAAGNAEGAKSGDGSSDSDEGAAGNGGSM